MPEINRHSVILDCQDKLFFCIKFQPIGYFLKNNYVVETFLPSSFKKKVTSEMVVEPRYKYELITLPTLFTLHTLLSAYNATLLTLRRLLSLLTLHTLLTQLRSKRAMIPDT